MRNPNTPRNASFSSPARVPVDVKYRVEQLMKNIAEAQKFLNALEPSMFGELFDGMKQTLEVAEAIADEMNRARPLTRTEEKECK